MPTGSSRFLTICCLLFPLYFCALDISAQQTPVAASSPSASPSPTPTVFSPQTLAGLKRLQQAALSSDYAYKQVAHLANNIGPRLSGSAQAAKAVEYVAGELRAIGCEVQLEKVWCRIGCAAKKQRCSCSFRVRQRAQPKKSCSARSVPASRRQPMESPRKSSL